MYQRPPDHIAAPYDARIAKGGESKISFKVGSQKEENPDDRPFIKFRYVRCTQSWRANSDDAIDIYKDDEIKVYNWEDDYWWYGERIDDRFQKRGLFPKQYVEPTGGPALKTDQSAQLGHPDKPVLDESVLHVDASKHTEAKKKEEIRRLEKKKKKAPTNDVERALVERRRKMKELLRGSQEEAEGSSDAQADEIAEAFTGAQITKKDKGKKDKGKKK